MRILQTYVLKELFAPTVVSMCFFTLLLLLRHFFTLAEILLNASVGVGLIMELAGIIIVTLFSLTIPMAALLGVLIGIGRMTSDNEILAVRVAGISLFPVFVPVFVLATLTSLLLVAGNRSFLPGLYARVQSQEQRIKFELLTSLKPETWYSDLSPKGSNMTLYFGAKGERQPGDPEYLLRMKEITMQASGGLAAATGDVEEEKKEDKKEEKKEEAKDDKLQDEKKEEKKKKDEDQAFIFAREGILRGDMATGSLTFELLDGTVVPFNRASNDETMILSFGRLAKVITPEVDNDYEELDPRQLSVAELKKIIDNPPVGFAKRQGKNRNLTDKWQDYYAARTELYSRNSLPFAVLAFVFLAVPLAIEIRPRAKSVAFIIAIILIVVYYAIMAWSNAVGSSGSDLAWLAAACPNLAIMAIGAILFWRTQRIV